MNKLDNPESLKANDILTKHITSFGIAAAFHGINKSNPLPKDPTDEILALLQAEIDKCLPEKIDDATALWSAQRGHPLTYNQALDDCRHRLKEFMEGTE